MLYIKKDNQNKWLIYFNNYKPTPGKLVLFKTINDTSLEEKVFLPASIVERDSFNIYNFFETSEENENLEEGRVYYSQGGYYNLEVYEDDVYTTTPTGSTVYTERVWIDLFIQTVSCVDYVYTTGSTVYVSPSNTIIERTNIGEYLPLSGGTMVGDITAGDIYFRLGATEFGSSIDIDNDSASSAYGDIYIYSQDIEQFKYSQIALKKDVLEINGTENFSGITYLEDYSSKFINRSLVDKAYVDGAISVITPDLSAYLPLSGGTMTGDITFSTNPNSGLNFGESYLDFDIRFDKNSESLVIKALNSDNNTDTSQIYVGINSLYLYSNKDLFLDADTITVFSTTNANFSGITYSEDYSANYTDRSLVDKAYVDSVAGSGDFLPLSGGEMSGFIEWNDGYTGIGYNSFLNALALYSSIDGTEASIFRLADTNIQIEGGPSFSGATYAADYSANFTDRSLVDKGYVDDNCVTRFEDGYKQTFADKVNYDTLSVGNGSTQVVAGFCLIKGGSMGPNGFIDMWGTLENELNASKLVNCNVRFGASPNLPTRNAAVPAEYTTLATYTFTTTQRSMSMERRLVNVGSESVQKIYPTGSNTANKTGAINVLLSSLTIDTSQDWYLIFTVQSTELTDFFRFIKLTGETTYIS
jgi:hypothetical protein